MTEISLLKWVKFSVTHWMWTYFEHQFSFPWFFSWPWSTHMQILFCSRDFSLVWQKLWKQLPDPSVCHSLFSLRYKVLSCYFHLPTHPNVIHGSLTCQRSRSAENELWFLTTISLLSIVDCSIMRRLNGARGSLNQIIFDLLFKCFLFHLKIFPEFVVFAASRYDD